jgi:hypothetical protein
MKISKINTSLTIVFDDGSLLTTNRCTDEMYETILENQYDEEVVRNLMTPNYQIMKEEIRSKQDMLDNFDRSEYLSVRGASIYVTSISQLSLPEDLAVAIWNAEVAKDLELLATYLNFWTLASMNLDPAARQNLFWFLHRYGMSISASGLFVAYRNVKVHSMGNTKYNYGPDVVKFITDSFTNIRFKQKKAAKDYYIGLIEGELTCTKSENRRSQMEEEYGNLQCLYDGLSDEEAGPVYTDGYTGKFRIRIGEPVTMDRARCDTNQNNTCSRGLHVAGKSWLQNNYFGDTGLRCLVNPADVVAVPPQDSYGKMRVCAYYPIGIVGFDENGNIMDEDIEDGFEDNFIDIISYAGEKSDKEVSAYTIDVPVIPELSRTRITARLDDIKSLLKLKHEQRS